MQYTELKSKKACVRQCTWPGIIAAMAEKSGGEVERLDSAAVFGAALSLWESCNKCAKENRINLSDCYNGGDQYMREVMRVAELFESWACKYVAFHELGEVWPYFLEDKFGDACMDVVYATGLDGFDESDCLRVAMKLRLPLHIDGKLPIPMDSTALNPVAGSGFREFRIQTVRQGDEEGNIIPYVWDDDPFDDEFGSPYFALYGIEQDGSLEHIADRNTFAEILSLAQKLAPRIEFPNIATPEGV